MTVRFKRISAIIIILLLICCGISYSHRNTNQNKLNQVKNLNFNLKGKIKYKQAHSHRPILTKKVPSAYKKLMMDGHRVANAQDVVIKQTNGGRKKSSTTAYRNAEGMLSDLIYLKSSNWNMKAAWTPFTNDKVKLMPGRANSNGNYDCSFIICNPRAHNRIDGIYEATYSAATRKFSNISDYGARQQKIPRKVARRLNENLVKRNHKHPVKRHVRGGSPRVR